MDQITRINCMERILDDACAAADSLRSALNRFEELRPQIDQLEAYYTGPLWRQDFSDDEAGKIPAHIKRGVLSEDAVYDLLCTIAQLKKAAGRL